MQNFFLSRVRGAWVLAWFAAAFGWFVAAFQLSGVWARFGQAQGGETPLWLDIEPFFSVDRAMAAIAHIHADRAEALAYTAYLIDLPFMLLHAGALAALVGFALRRSGVGGWVASALFCLPLLRLLGDLFENAALAASIAMAQPSATLLQVASVSGGLKTAGAVASIVASISLIVFALGAWAVRKLRR